ncbi:MAG TPA: hypothetical protein VKC89_02025 [Patescibacteria group bacterium]|nr:hypothetical protein [Patescibacteria group bacterium]
MAVEVEPKKSESPRIKYGVNRYGEPALSADDYFRQMDVIFPDNTPSGTGQPFVGSISGREKLKTGHRGFLKNSDQEIEGLIPQQSPPSFSEASQR